MTLKSLGRQARVDRAIDAKTFEVSMGSMKMKVSWTISPELRREES